jgi:hypothetical protein
MRRLAVLAAILACLVPAVAMGQATPVGTPTVTYQTYVAGNAFDFVPKGKKGELSVVSVGKPTTSSGNVDLPFVVRNRTGGEVGGLDMQVAMKTKDGKLFAVSNLTEVAPAVVPNGEVAIGTANFRNITAPEGATFEFTITPSDHLELLAQSEMVAVTSADFVENRVVGYAKNVGPKTFIAGPILVACFSGGELATVVSDFLTDRIAPGAKIPFQVSAGQCDRFLVAIS